MKKRKKHSLSAARRITVIGLTGGIAMGKSTIAKICKARGIHSISADAIVHNLFAKGGKAVAAIAALCPEAVVNGAVDRRILGAEVFTNPTKLAALEAILHPLVRTAEERFVRAMRAKGARCVLLDIPLLFETGAEQRVDVVWLASAPAWLQRQRALKRPGMTPEKLAHILARQMPEREKRRRADVIIPTGLGLGHSAKHVKKILKRETRQKNNSVKHVRKTIV